MKEVISKSCETFAKKTKFPAFARLYLHDHSLDRFGLKPAYTVKFKKPSNKSPK